MLTLCYRDYITIERSNNIILSFQNLNIEPNDFPTEFGVMNKSGSIYGEFTVDEPSYDENGIVRDVVYRGHFIGDKEWVATIYNSHYI